MHPFWSVGWICMPTPCKVIFKIRSSFYASCWFEALTCIIFFQYWWATDLLVASRHSVETKFHNLLSFRAYPSCANQRISDSQPRAGFYHQVRIALALVYIERKKLASEFWKHFLVPVPSWTVLLGMRDDHYRPQNAGDSNQDLQQSATILCTVKDPVPVGAAKSWCRAYWGSLKNAYHARINVGVIAHAYSHLH